MRVGRRRALLRIGLELALVAGLAGCGRAAPAIRSSPAPWERSSESLSPEQATLRRRHSAGDRFRARFELAGRMTVDSRSVPFRFDLGWQEEILAAPSAGPFSVEFSAHAADVSLADERETLSFPVADEGPALISSRNQRLNPSKTSPDARRPADSMHFALTPDPMRLLSLELPKQQLSPGDQWEGTSERVVGTEDQTPTLTRLRSTWTFLGIEHSVTGSWAHLQCSGTWLNTGEAAGRGESAEAHLGGPIACAVRLDLADGRTSSWRVEFEGRGTVVHRKATGVETTTVGSRGRVLGDIERDRFEIVPPN